LQNAVLIVEDDRDMRELLAQILVEEGYGVGVASNGIGAISYLQSNRAPRVILLDWRMPKSDGIEFCRMQRADPRLSQIPVVLMTADLRVDQRSSEFGAAELLIKPVEVERLLQVVSRFAGPPLS
jgi:two-component system phosphate regulon response regulator PhoB